MFALTLPFPWLTNAEEDEAGAYGTGLASTPMAATSSTELIAARLQHQQLVRSSKRDPAEVVAWLGAMQAQDFSSAKWAIGLRAPACHESSIDEAFNDGHILRTHVLRPTWHFVAATDIKWLLSLTAPSTLASAGRRLRRCRRWGGRGRRLLRCLRGAREHDGRHHTHDGGKRAVSRGFGHSRVS